MSPLGTFSPGSFGRGGAFVRGSFAPGTFSPGVFCPGALLARGIFVQEGFCPGSFCPGGLLPGGTFIRGAYARSPQFQCVYAQSRLSVPSIIYVYPAGGCIQLTYQERDGQKKDKLGPVAPWGLDPRSPNFQGM